MEAIKLTSSKFFGDIRFYSRWSLDYLFQASLLTLAVVIPFSLFTNTSFLYAWEWVHKEILIAYLWYFAPVFTVYVIAVIYLTNKGTSKKILNLVNYPLVFHRAVFFIFISIIIGAFSQVLGGCVWQLPVILEGWAGYQWRRFGHEYFSDWLLVPFYFTITAAYVVLLYKYMEIVRKLK